MPSDVVTIVVSTGIGVSVVAGVLSGVCYILAHGFTRKRSRRTVLEWHCIVCGKYLRLRSLDHVKAVICLECEERVCKLRCSKPDYVRRGWICYTCLKEPSLIQGIVSAIRLQFNRFKEQSLKNTNNLLQIENMKKNIEEIRKPEKYDHIRDFIEKLVSTILGENVDDASVLRIYNDKRYDTLFEKYHGDLKKAITDLTSALHISMNNVSNVEQSPSTAHTTLKQVIENIVREALNLPNFNKAIEYESTASQREQTYEELLATAILNKVVSKCQRNLPSTSPIDLLNRTSTSTPDNETQKEYFFGEETLDAKWNPTDGDSTSNSSLNEYLHSDSSSTSGSTKYVDHVSLTIRQRIEEVPPEDVDDDGREHIHYLRENASLLDNDDTNWYLQRPRIHGSRSPIPVPMLVPNPTTVAKVLIGDKEIDDTSDLSDAISESDEIESVDGIQNYMVKTKTIIGGHNPIRRISSVNLSDEETSVDSGVKADKDDSSDKITHSFGFPPKADKTVDDENISLTSFNSNFETNLEYSEKYASLPRTILKSPAPIRRFGRDYYTKQASLPSGRKKNDEDENDFLYRQDETETYIFRATPAQSQITNEEIGDPFTITESRDDVNNVQPPNSDFDLISFEDTEELKQDKGICFGNEKEIIISVNTEGLLYNPEENARQSPPLVSEEELKEFIPVDPSFDKNFSTYEINDYSPTKESSDDFQTIPKKAEINLELPPVPKVKPRTLVNINKDQPKPTAQKREHVSEAYPEKSTEQKPQTENGDKSFNIISNKKSDNTWIKRIYNDPRVRSFALTNREHIPVKLDDNFKQPETPKPVVKQEPPLIKTISVTENNNNYDVVNNNFDLLSPQHNVNDHINNNFDLLYPHHNDNENTFSLEFSDSDSIHDPTYSKKEPRKEHNKNDLHELKEKRIVAGRLGEFSKSFPNLSKLNIPGEKYSAELKSTETINKVELYDESETSSTQIFTSVKDLRKLFESNCTSYNKDKPVHSLTARSLSKQMKEKLKDFDSSDK